MHKKSLALIKKQTLLGVACVFLGFVSSNTMALGISTLTSTDWLVAGDNKVTVDGNGLEWLDLTETQGMNYFDVTAQMGGGGTLDGWRYATTFILLRQPPMTMFHLIGLILMTVMVNSQTH